MSIALNEMLIRRRESIFIEKGTDILPIQYLATILKNIETYGYTFSQDVIELLKTQNVNMIIDFYNDIITIIKNNIGFKENLLPMYPNFPKQVMEMDKSELYINAIIHYLSDDKLLPLYEKEEREPFVSNNKLKIIGLCPENAIKEIFCNLLKSPVSLSETDKNDICLIMDTYNDIYTLLPSINISFKETLIFLTEELRKRNITMNISSLYKNATDVLRLAVAMSDGDISLSKKTDFKKFKRSEKKFLLNLLENANNIEEDMLRHKTTWLRLGERLNVRSFKNLKKVNTAFYKIRNGVKIKTFNSELEKAFLEKNTKQILRLLLSRPSEFARNLDRLLRLDSSISNVYAFGTIADEIPTPILLQLKTYFENRNNKKDLRMFMPKNGTIYSIENNLPNLNENIRCEVLKICNNSLLKAYSNKKPLGKVYIDPLLKDILIPTTQRNSTKSLKSLAKGSIIPFNGNTKVLRAFCYWKQPKTETVDLDLSAIFLDSNFQYISNIFYQHLVDKNLNSCHSGDITSAPNGAIEYVDIDINKALSNDVRYVGIVVNSYTNTPFCDLPECYYGIMEREIPQAGEIFEPTTVKNKIDISCDKEQVLAFIIDLKNNNMICADIPIKSHCTLNNIMTNKNNLILNMKAIINSNKPNLYDLFELHAKARGIKEYCINADIIFCLNKENFIEEITKIEKQFLEMAVENKEILNKQLVEKEKILNSLSEDDDNRKEILKTINALKSLIKITEVGFEEAGFKSVINKIKFITPYDVDIILSEYI